jgi:hypothetical protein
LGQTRRSSCLGMSASPPTPDVSLQGNEPTNERHDSLHSITSSAVTSSVAGTVRPSGKKRKNLRSGKKKAAKA